MSDVLHTWGGDGSTSPAATQQTRPVGTLQERADGLSARREPYVRATVVRAQRPTSAHAGDTALVLSDGAIDGFVGGTCVEASVRRFGLKVLGDRRPLLLRVVPGVPSSAFEEGAVEVANPCLSNGAIEIFLEPVLPLPRVLVVGGTPVALALADLGPHLDLQIVLSDGAAARPSESDDALIVASHGRDEEPALTAALQAGVPYVALVASFSRGAAVLRSLDVTPEQRASVFSPAGLDLGARTPGEIALSILAQLVQQRATRAAPVIDDAVPDTAELDKAESDTVGLDAVDPVCGMSVPAVAESLHVVHEGQPVYFCAPGCRRAFIADPAAYAFAS
ncbi:XdhC family protein [Cryobacterium sp. CG_9.6]|uniref:XdhC family protein n=1 Tax=Cryobacterium sp. CG_9.6 TaxID=2760710 RepID=UPI0024739A0B|nr:XdhC family protein [Cryobacterium sp. CG_9.6]MDH6237774.1 xanthine dehydrogenase accessory factor [Cryobacterium sp. CG_9.6]